MYVKSIKISARSYIKLIININPQRGNSRKFGPKKNLFFENSITEKGYLEWAKLFTVNKIFIITLVKLIRKSF